MSRNYEEMLAEIEGINKAIKHIKSVIEDFQYELEKENSSGEYTKGQLRALSLIKDQLKILYNVHNK